MRLASTGATLAALLAGDEPDPAPFAAMPSFWSDQYEHMLQSFGMPGLATSIAVIDDPDGNPVELFQPA